MKFRDFCIFDMRKSNVDFDTRVGESLYSNKTKFMFDGLDAKFIPVGEETKDLICIRNDNSDMMKIQFSKKKKKKKTQTDMRSEQIHKSLF